MASGGTGELAWISEGVLSLVQTPPGLLVKAMKRWPGRGAILIAAKDGSVWKWDIREEKLIEFRYASGSLSSMEVSHSGDKLALGYADGSVKIVSLRSSQLLDEFTSGSSQVMQLHFDPAEDRLCVQFKKEVYIRSLDKSGEMLRLPSDQELNGSCFFGDVLIAAEKETYTLKPWPQSMNQIAEKLCMGMADFKPLTRGEISKAGLALSEWPQKICKEE